MADDLSPGTPLATAERMTWKDKLEIGLKDDAACRKDNLPANQVRGPQIPAGPGRSPDVPLACEDETQVPDADSPAKGKTP